MEKSASTKLPALLLGLVLGVAIGALGTYRILESQKATRLEAAKAANHYEGWPEGFLFPPGTTFEDLFPDAELREALLNPDSIQIHAADDAGSLIIDEWRFAAAGVTPDADTAVRLKYALGSISTYEPSGKLCVFHADVLLRLGKNGRTHDIVFCFGCGETSMRADISETGRRTLFKCFCDSLPDFKSLHEKRAAFEARR